MILTEKDSILYQLDALFGAGHWKAIKDYFLYLKTLENYAIDSLIQSQVKESRVEELNYHIAKRNIIEDIYTDFEQNVKDFVRNSLNSDSVQNTSES